MYTLSEAEMLIKDKQAEFFPSPEYLFIGTRTDGYIKPDEIFMKGQDGNFHLHWPRPK